MSFYPNRVAIILPADSYFLSRGHKMSPQSTSSTLVNFWRQSGRSKSKFGPQIWRTNQGRFYLGEGVIAPQTSTLPPNVTWNTVWRTQSIGIQVQKVVLRWGRGLQNTPKCVSGRGSTPLGSSRHSSPHPHSILLPSAPRFGGGIAPKHLPRTAPCYKLVLGRQGNPTAHGREIVYTRYALPWLKHTQ